MLCLWLCLGVVDCVCFATGYCCVVCVLLFGWLVMVCGFVGGLYIVCYGWVCWWFAVLVRLVDTFRAGVVLRAVVLRVVWLLLSLDCWFCGYCYVLKLIVLI